MAKIDCSKSDSILKAIDRECGEFVWDFSKMDIRSNKYLMTMAKFRFAEKSVIRKAHEIKPIFRTVYKQ